MLNSDFDEELLVCTLPGAAALVLYQLKKMSRPYSVAAKKKYHKVPQ